MLRCLTIRCLVARHTDDGDARYSSVRQLFHVSSEHDTLGQTPSTQTPSSVGPHHSGRSRASRRKDSINYSSHPSSPTWRAEVIAPHMVRMHGPEPHT